MNLNEKIAEALKRLSYPNPGHKGLPGVHGGSSPRKGGSKTTAPHAYLLKKGSGFKNRIGPKSIGVLGNKSAPVREHEPYLGNAIPEAREVAVKLVAEGKELEKVLTPLLQEIADKVGGVEFFGLDFRLKTVESTEEAIYIRMKEDKGYTMEESIEYLSDVNRYTFGIAPNSLVPKTLQIHELLDEKGWVEHDHKFKNLFGSGGSYEGYNCVFENTETGARVEIQFHTPESWDIKMKNHKFYERNRTISPDSTEYDKLNKLMVKNWQTSKTYVRPDDLEELPGVHIKL